MVHGSSTSTSFAVRSFYNSLPFNFRNDAATHAAALRSINPLLAYPPLASSLAASPSLLDVGCGTGWLVSASAFYHKCTAHGIDIADAAIERARAVANLLCITPRFETADLFLYRPDARFQLVTSLGVMHHTTDCLGAIARVCGTFVADGGRVFIGLYHEYGRRAFYEHFDGLKRRGLSQEAMFDSFRKLWVGSGRSYSDEMLLQSWFQDQVFHPHETWHTLKQLLPLLDDLGYELEATSINRFAPLPTRRRLLEYEKEQEEVGRIALAAGRFYPGFFVVMARHRSRGISDNNAFHKQ
jgi:SAM-dependent methyltransferase